MLRAFTVNSLPDPLVWLYALKGRGLCSKRKGKQRNYKASLPEKDLT